MWLVGGAGTSQSPQERSHAAWRGGGAEAAETLCVWWVELRACTPASRINLASRKGAG